jgi:transposase-like protein
MVTFTCPHCNKSDIVKRGKRYNKVKTKQLYRCNDCRATFVEPDGFERMRHKPEDIVRAIHQYNDGLSLYKVKNHLWQHDNVRVSRWAISKWHKKYSIFLKSDSSLRKAKTQRKAAYG